MVAADCLPIGGIGSCRFKGGNTYRATPVHTPGAEVKHMLQAGRLCCHGMDPMNFRTSISFVRPMWTSTKRLGRSSDTTLLTPAGASCQEPLAPVGLWDPLGRRQKAVRLGLDTFSYHGTRTQEAVALCGCTVQTACSTGAWYGPQ